MNTITARNTNTLQPQLHALFRCKGKVQASRNGDTLVLDGPTMVEIQKPWERVSMCPVRDANPFFHAIEAMAMLADFNSVALLSRYAKNMLSFSDDGLTYNAFYGSRIRHTWGDQLQQAVKDLRADPDSRRVVVQIWDPMDSTRESLDKACNMSIVFKIRDGKLIMNTFNRSNDAIWGFGGGANVVHFSYFMEYVATELGIAMGSWYHVSADMHIYLGNPKWEKLKHITDPTAALNHPEPIYQPVMFWSKQGLRFTETLRGFLHDVLNNRLAAAYRDFPFIDHTLRPLALSHQAYVAGDQPRALGLALKIKDTSWSSACYEWLKRRKPKTPPTTENQETVTTNTGTKV